MFARTPDSAYVIPRPDGAPQLASACNDPSHHFNALVLKYRLCRAAANSSDVERLNDMAPADALAIAHFMHRELHFTSMGTDIWPRPLPNDILDACALHPRDASAELVYICDRERERMRSGHDIAFSYFGLGGIELAALLNELYGIL